MGCARDQRETLVYRGQNEKVNSGEGAPRLCSSTTLEIGAQRQLRPLQNYRDHRLGHLAPAAPVYPSPPMVALPRRETVLHRGLATDKHAR